MSGGYAILTALEPVFSTLQPTHRNHSNFPQGELFLRRVPQKAAGIRVQFR